MELQENEEDKDDLDKEKLIIKADKKIMQPIRTTR